MTDGTPNRFKAIVAIVLAGLMLSACTTREMLSGAAGGAAGYIIGKETAEDDD